MKNFYKILINIIFIIVVLLFGNKIVQAAEAPKCCKVTEPGKPSSAYAVKDETECKKMAKPSKNIKAEFKPGLIPSADKKDCVTDTSEAKNGPSKIIPPKLSVSIPGFGKFSEVSCSDATAKCQIPWIAEYISAIYKYTITLIGIIAVVMVMAGGVLWLTSAGNNAKIGQAMNFIKSGVTGIVITLCSFLVLYIINPDLTVLKTISISYQERVDLTELEKLPDTTTAVDGNFSLDSSRWIEIPQAPGLCFPAGSKSGPESVEALKKAGECLNKINPKHCIEGTGARDIENQKGKYDACCPGGKCGCKCSPEVCCPYPIGEKLCPHTTGSAFDLNTHTSFYDSEVKKCMKEAGFCRLCSEAWHWEFPKLSSGCTCD